MSTTTLIDPPTAVRELPTIAEMRDELQPLIGAVVVAGPPVAFLAVPYALGTLLLAGPFALAVTGLVVVVVALVAAAAVVALAGAIVAAPYLLVRRLREHHPSRAHAGGGARQLVAVGSTHATA